MRDKPKLNKSPTYNPNPKGMNNRRPTAKGRRSLMPTRQASLARINNNNGSSITIITTRNQRFRTCPTATSSGSTILALSGHPKFTFNKGTA